LLVRHFGVKATAVKDPVQDQVYQPGDALSETAANRTFSHATPLAEDQGFLDSS
jgi:hypothetical protein